MTRDRVNTKNLKQLCWRRGMSVSDFAKRLGKRDKVVWHAVRRPKDYPMLYDKIQRELNALSE